MNMTEEQVKHPILLLIVRCILSVFILIALSRIVYAICHYAGIIEGKEDTSLILKVKLHVQRQLS